MDIYSYHHFIFMRLLFPLIACLLLCLLPLSLSYNQLPLCHQEERVALMQFKDSFIIQNNSFYGEYPKVASWGIDGNNTHCCAWDGVECNQDTGHVIALNLSRSCLYGSITSNSSLFRLLHLQNLTLSYNDFNHSQIPSEIGNLSSLTHLDLFHSHFSGQIPSEIQYLSKLSYLRLSSSFDAYNDLYTKLSQTSLLQNLTNLKVLGFYGINISSTVLESLANLSSLQILVLTDCGLYGRFPTRIFQLPHLQGLSISNNEDLTGHLPEFHTNSPLEGLELDNTNFSGNLPASIGNLNSLTYFSIGNCNFSGTIPNSFSNLTQLTYLDLSQNSFNDLSWLTRASSNDILPQFEYLGLAHLKYLTKFPDILRNQSKLWWLDLEGSNLQGLIPKWMHNVSKESLQYFYLSNNFLTGFENSPAIIPWPNLVYFDLKNNTMHGSLPIPPPSLVAYFVCSNSFTGRISPFICNMSLPEVLDLSHNYLSGMIHPCIGNLSKSLSALVLRSNNFGHTIPKAWAKGCSINMIDLSENQLQGHLPRSLANCTELEYLHVGRNQFNDTDPFWLETLQQLKILILHSNGFHGAIRSPETNYTFPNLRIIDVSHNYFSGNLPAGYFAQWDAMKSVVAKNLKYLDDISSVDYSIIITIKGVELEYKKIQDGLTVIDFSCNRFEGDIPEILGNLEGLHALNLSNNAFTGHIPSSFANLTQLESLDLSQNKLFGQIPPELVQLNFLSKFNVSHNCLTGPIPQGQQFGTFPNTSFEDNRGLCGRPLSKICGDSDISTPPPSTFEENQGPKLFFEFRWKVVVMGCGCGFVFGVVIGHIGTTRKQDWLIKIFGKKQHQTRISRVNRRDERT
ncbi:receptor-like protein 32 isoform X2 [Juglans microcarpa x Juglans regia]|uniref:receptor-like protein 32 isoform X2 n=1 Tax=Juglans microcarpa x Juglans regia TaxID=2249226 RepID=UPI001B7DD947|nr:receptor-like protein 32 isoform X2 [Juglans microcarpa x Juglans regia]